MLVKGAPGVDLIDFFGWTKSSFFNGMKTRITYNLTFIYFTYLRSLAAVTPERYVRDTKDAGGTHLRWYNKAPVIDKSRDWLVYCTESSF